MDAVGLWDGERVLVVSNTCSARLEIYTIVGERGNGEICVSGAVAHLISVDEEIIIVGFELTDRAIEPPVIVPSDRNRQFVQLIE
jgi:aspartate 1-decarboxylase